MTLQKACKRRAWVLYFMYYLVSGVFGMVAQTDGTVSAGNINCIDVGMKSLGIAGLIGLPAAISIVWGMYRSRTATDVGEI